MKSGWQDKQGPLESELGEWDPAARVRPPAPKKPRIATQDLFFSLPPLDAVSTQTMRLLEARAAAAPQDRVRRGRRGTNTCWGSTHYYCTCMTLFS
jgi:hypothetical protein